MATTPEQAFNASEILRKAAENLACPDETVTQIAIAATQIINNKQ